MTQDQARRVQEAIAECDKFIAKESCRRDDLRPADVQKFLDFCISHRASLAGMLAAA